MYHNEVKSDKEVKELPIQEELREAKESLTKIWQKILPIDQKNPYSLDDKTLSVLISSELDKTSDVEIINKLLDADFLNPFKLNQKQHESLVVALNVMMILVNEMIIGFTYPRPAAYAYPWKPPQERTQVSYVRCNLDHAEEEKLVVTHHDVPVHFENHVYVYGKKSRTQKNEVIIENIPAGEMRARSILGKLIKPLIKSFNNVSESSSCMQKLCDSLAPSNDHACCIDARTRQAFDYALSDDVTAPTFTDLLNDAINCCPDEYDDNYFYLVATLMKNSWGKKYKADTGTNGLCKKEGTLSMDSHEFIQSGFPHACYKIKYTNDFLYAYEIVPKELQPEYLKLIIKEKDFFKSFLILSIKDREYFSKLISAKISGHSFLYYILTKCNPQIAKKFIANSPYSELDKIDDIWTKLYIFKYHKLEQLDYFYFKLFLNKINPEFLESVIKEPHNNPFNTGCAKDPAELLEILNLIGHKLKPQDLANLYFDANINHPYFLSDSSIYSKLSSLIPASMLSPLEQIQEQKAEEKAEVSAMPSVSTAGIFSLKIAALQDFLSKEHQSGSHHLPDLLQHDEYIQFKQKNLKCLLQAIVSGNPNTVEDMINRYPILLFTKLKEKEMVVAPSGHKANSKPYQMALAVGDTHMAAKIKIRLTRLAGIEEATEQWYEQFPEGRERAEQEKWLPIFVQC